MFKPHERTAKFHCHQMVYDTALELARTTVEYYARTNNAWWKENKDKFEFHAKRLAPKLLEQARTTLAGLLAQPIPELLKEQITDALIKDNSLRVQRGKYRVEHGTRTDLG